ncbi:MAG: DUF1127 domain-containing protein [Rhodobacterales bacterium]|nr:MAG: DUF1127 domain-containing protein [Rhodobacterales bacterium]
MPLQTKTLPLRRVENPAVRFFAAISAALTRRRDRALLARLDSHLLRDIGIAPEDAKAEAAKPFWQS